MDEQHFKDSNVKTSIGSGKPNTASYLLKGILKQNIVKDFMKGRELFKKFYIHNLQVIIPQHHIQLHYAKLGLQFYTCKYWSRKKFTSIS